MQERQRLRRGRAEKFVGLKIGLGVVFEKCFKFAGVSVSWGILFVFFFHQGGHFCCTFGVFVWPFWSCEESNAFCGDVFLVSGCSALRIQAGMRRCSFHVWFA